MILAGDDEKKYPDCSLIFVELSFFVPGKKILNNLK